MVLQRSSRGFKDYRAIGRFIECILVTLNTHTQKQCKALVPELAMHAAHSGIDYYCYPNVHCLQMPSIACMHLFGILTWPLHPPCPYQGFLE